MVNGNKPIKRSLSSAFNSLFGKPSQEEDKADDFKSQKNVIAAYRTSLQDEAKKRQTVAPAGPAAPATAPEKKDRLSAIYARKEATVPTTPEPKPALRPEPQIKPLTPKPASAKPAGANDGKKVYSSNSWEAPHILKTNLISGEVTTFVSWAKYINVTILALFVSAVVIGMLYFGLIFWEKRASNQTSQLVDEINALDIDIENLKDGVKAADLFQRRLNLSAELMDGHIYWTEFFRAFEGLFLSDAVVSGSFSGALDGHYQFSVTVDSYESIYDQLTALRQNPLIKSFEVSSGNLESTKDKADSAVQSLVHFNLDVTIDPEILKKKQNEGS